MMHQTSINDFLDPQEQVPLPPPPELGTEPGPPAISRPCRFCGEQMYAADYHWRCSDHRHLVYLHAGRAYWMDDGHLSIEDKEKWMTKK